MDTFLKCLPYLFENDQQRYLISHYLWQGENEIKKLVFYLRAYDLIQRMYFVNFKKFPSKEVGAFMLDELLKKPKLMKHLTRIAENGIFPDNINSQSFQTLKLT